MRAQGKGSFVASAKIGVALRPMVSFGNELRRQGHEVDARTLSVEWAAAPSEVVQWLGLEDGQGTHIQRLLTVDGVPLTFFDHWLAPTVPHAVFLAAGNFPSLYQLLQEQGREPWYGTETIGASVADREMADMLDYEEGAPLVTLLRVSRDMERRPVEYTNYVVRADRYEYEINLMRQRR